jgi:hypothetical protein
VERPLRDSAHEHAANVGIVRGQCSDEGERGGTRAVGQMDAVQAGEAGRSQMDRALLERRRLVQPLLICRWRP